MKLTLADVDPELVGRMRARVTELVSDVSGHAASTEPLAIAVRKRMLALRGAISVVGASSAVTIALASWLCQGLPDQAPFPYVLTLANLPLYFYLRGRIVSNAEPRLWRAFTQGTGFSRVEKAYLEALSAVERSEAELGQPFLKCLNELIVAGRSIERKLSELQRYHNEVTVESLQQELESLERRVVAASSPEAAQTLQQSAVICAGRLENRRALGRVEERLEAQVEAICQTIASVSGTLAQAHVAPLSQNTPLLQNLAQTVEEITRQTQATEAAVQEVLAMTP